MTLGPQAPVIFDLPGAYDFCWVEIRADQGQYFPCPTQTAPPRQPG
jgi:hypothetical protein